LFFPKEIRKDVYILYSFLRTADDIVDEKNYKKLFIDFKTKVYRAINENHKTENLIIDSFAYIFKRYKFNIDYLDSFFEALESDFKTPLQIKTFEELKKYAYGVAGVVGLMMGKIMKLEVSLLDAAKNFGEAMQIINIIRDVKEDYLKNRVYIPKEDLDKYGVSNIINFSDKRKFNSLIRFNLERVIQKLNSLTKDINEIPSKYRVPIKISKNIYRTIAKK